MYCFGCKVNTYICILQVFLKNNYYIRLFLFKRV
nr:MAG TPA: hypothetical protein [Caudoviricetes sp.]